MDPIGGPKIGQSRKAGAKVGPTQTQTFRARGRIVYQELTRITKSAQDGDMDKNEALLKAMNNAKDNGKALHLMGLLSDGGVHSHNTHLYALLEMAKRVGVEKVFVHCFMDGRDVPPSSGKDYVKELMDKLEEIGVGKIATVMGRYYAMDRDNRWERVEKAYAAMVYGEGEQAECPCCAMQNSYDKEVTDEFVVPTVIKGAEPSARATASSSTTSAPTGPGKSPALWWTPISPALSGRRASSP